MNLSNTVFDRYRSVVIHHFMIEVSMRLDMTLALICHEQSISVNLIFISTTFSFSTFTFNFFMREF